MHRISLIPNLDDLYDDIWNFFETMIFRWDFGFKVNVGMG